MRASWLPRSPTALTRCTCRAKPPKFTVTEGLLVSVDDLDQIAVTVREYLWTAL
jgi:hypothetical protein